MGTRNPASTGAGYSDISTAGPNMSGPGIDQQHNQYHLQVATLNATGDNIPPYQYQCTCGACFYRDQHHTQQCLDLNRNMEHAFLQYWQAPPPQPMEQAQPCPGGDRQPAVQLRSDIDYEMKDVADVNGGRIEEVEDPKQQAHPGEMGAVPPPDQATTVVHFNGGAEMVIYSVEKKWHGGHDQAGVPSRLHGGPGCNPDESPVTHECCNTLCPTGKCISHATAEKKLGMIGRFLKSLGTTNEYDIEQQDPLSAIKDNLRKEKEDMMRRVNDVQTQLDQRGREHKEALRKKDEELRRKNEELRRRDEELKRREEELRELRGGRHSDKSQIASLSAELQDAKARRQREMKIHDNQVANLTAKLAEYKGMADRLGDQLSALEQSNSKSAVWTGAHRDSDATPSNLGKAAFLITGAALGFTKTFFTFLKERKALQTHLALQTVPPGADERYRKYAVESYICSRLFAGFENDSYVDSLDCAQGAPFLPEKYEETEFFLQNQDPKVRHQRYVDEYESLQKLGLVGVMEVLKTNKAAMSTNSFHQFCCRKLVNIVGSLDGWFQEFELLPGADYSKESILHQLAANPKYCDKFLKPFINLAMVAFLFHRLAFQFHPPARIFRYAPGTQFDKNYMESAVIIDDDDPVEGFVVGLMLVPGFQVGATIVKCTVYLVPSAAKPPASDHAKLQIGLESIKDFKEQNYCTETAPNLMSKATYKLLKKLSCITQA